MRKIFFHFALLLALLILSGQGCLSLVGEQPPTSGPAGMFISTDKGNSWEPISLLPTAAGVRDLSGVSVYRLFSDPGDPRALYWATRNHGFFYSYDDGRSWQQSPGDLAQNFIYSMAVHPGDRCTIYAANGERVLKTEDCSRSWDEVYRESRVDIRAMSLVFNPVNAKQLLLLESNGDVLQSVDGGQSWEVRQRFETEAAEIFADPLQRDVFYVATRVQGLYRSKDGGKTWESLQSNMKDFSGAVEFRRFFVHPKKIGVLYWISTYGILQSLDGGDTWGAVPLITPPGSVQIYGFAVNPKNENEMYYTATISNRSTFYRTVDGGKNWVTKKLPSGQIPTMLYAHPTKDLVLYLGFTIPPK